jgi:transposase InsO family protein
MDYARCHFRKHPGYNKEKNKSWADSTNGKSYKTAQCEDKNGKLAGRDQVSFWHHPDGTKLNETEIADLKKGGMTRPKRLNQGGEKKVHQLPFSILATYVTTQNKSYLRPFSILCRQEKAGEGTGANSKRNKRNSKDIAVKALIDTGAVQSSYISITLAQKLHKLGLIHKRTNKRICSGLNNASCTTATDSYDLELTFVNEKTNLEELLVINAQVIDCRFDLIIGQPDIFAFDLTDKFPSLFSKSWTESHASRKLQASEQPIMRDVDGAVCAECTCSHTAANPKVSEPPVEKLIVSKDALLDQIDPDDDMIEDLGCPWESEPSQTSEDINRVPDENLHGSPEFKKKLRAILDAYEEIFRATLTKEPAKVPLFELKVDTAKWLANAAGKAPRQMSKEKMKETERQIQSMLSLELIRESHASAVSHVMLAPKPGGKWRFCVDYRTLNLFSETTKWPIPNIKMMLERIGNKRAKFFGILDLSQGFYQVPLSEKSKALTAFITWCGTYEWNRLPMGIKGAPPFFQQIMATIVLASLIYVICELYIDDILLHAQTEDEFCANLTTILDRCRQHNIKLNPKKCCLGMSEVEYVGHTVNETGMHFKRSKLDSVLDFELPTYGKQLKSFIGFCNYFRDHVENFSAKMFPLNALLKDYDKRRRLVWTEETKQAFEEMKNAIHECPALFFMDDDLPVYLHTDASKYGIGAYLFQLTPEGKEKPIAFISKTLTDTQRRWHTPQKEAYAIYYAFTQLEHLLRGVKFLLRTDHKNLVYINDTMTEMVIRWKIAVQQYDFDIEHIPGPLNIVADGLSRLIPGEASSQTIPIILAALCPPFYPLESENEEEEHFFCSFWQQDAPEEVLCAKISTEKPIKIPEDIRSVIGRSHNSLVGHHGRERTVAKVMEILQQKKYKKLADQFSDNDHLRTYIKEFIDKCPVCQKLSTLKVPIQAHTFTTATYEPHQRLNMDTIGPFPDDEDGYCYILVIIDTFTRWIELFPIKSTTAAETAQILLQHFGRFGQAQEIQHDNGSQFVNSIIAELSLLLGIDQKRTLAYSSEENAIVERANKEVLRHLRAILMDRKVKEQWRIYLPFVQRIMNSAVSLSTGVSPAQLLFGNAITLNRSILVDLPIHVRHDLSEWANNMVQAQYLIIDKAVAYQTQLDQKNRAKRQREEPTEFEDGSLVLVEYHKKGFKKGPPNKLLANLKGPYQVIEHDQNTYKLRDLGSEKIVSHHVTDIHPFKYDPEHTDPVEVALTDKDLFIVDAVVAHKGNPRRKSEMTFTVKWKGYEGHPDEYTDNQLYKDLKNNVAFHEYCRAHKELLSLIPQQFR